MAPGVRGAVTLSVLGLALASAACGASAPPTVPSCSYTVSGVSQVYAAGGGTGTVTVTTGASCAWTARTDAGWIAITSGATGTGTGSVAFSVGANATTSSRSAGLIVADHTVPVTQDGATPCAYDLSATSATHTKDAGTHSFEVLTAAGCRWTAASSASWITVAPGSAEGTGPGTVSYGVSRNTDSASRAAQIAVADRTFAVVQSGDAGACQYSVSPTDFSPCMNAAQMTVNVVTQAGCTWTAKTTDSWLSISTGTSSSGSGVIVFSVTANWLAPRSGQVLVRWDTPTAGQNVRVAQAGCHYAVSPGSASIVASGGPGTFDVFQQSDPNTCGGALQNACLWTAESTVPWITVTSSMPRAGDDRVSYSVSKNDGPARSGTIVVRDQVFRINQAGV